MKFVFFASYSDHDAVGVEITVTPELGAEGVSNESKFLPKEDEEERRRKDELVLLEALALFEKESVWARRCQRGTAAIAAAFPVMLMW